MLDDLSMKGNMIELLHLLVKTVKDPFGELLPNPAVFYNPVNRRIS